MKLSVSIPEYVVHNMKQLSTETKPGIVKLAPLTIALIAVGIAVLLVLVVCLAVAVVKMKRSKAHIREVFASEPRVRRVPKDDTLRDVQSIPLDRSAARRQSQTAGKNQSRASTKSHYT